MRAEPKLAGDESVSLFDVGGALLRARWMIVAFAFAGALVGLASGLLRARRFVSSALIIPQSNESGAASGLALAASQFGIKVPTGGNTWGPPVFVELLRSRVLLEPIVLDTFPIAEDGGRRVPMLEILKVPASDQLLRNERGIIALRKYVIAAEDKRVSGVTLSVETKWPSVSFTIAKRLVDEVNRFILEERKSQAAAERQFVELQVVDAQKALRFAEDDLQRFLQQNLGGSSPQLQFQRERLQRELSLRQQLYSSLVQNREDARIREVRDTPVLTILEAPRLPVIGEPRSTIQKTALGLFGGALFAIVLLYPMHQLRTARQSSDGSAREFFSLLDDITPRFLKRRAS